ncbi:hypothetical protein AGMMS49982_14420 [Bacteroidia bacterium]|nr:hypothetical protein AGMMS49982_14420 [Bacteroidia bacterium]
MKKKCYLLLLSLITGSFGHVCLAEYVVDGYHYSSYVGDYYHNKARDHNHIDLYGGASVFVNYFNITDGVVPAQDAWIEIKVPFAEGWGWSATAYNYADWVSPGYLYYSIDNGPWTMFATVAEAYSLTKSNAPGKDVVLNGVNGENVQRPEEPYSETGPEKNPKRFFKLRWFPQQKYMESVKFKYAAKIYHDGEGIAKSYVDNLDRCFWYSESKTFGIKPAMRKPLINSASFNILDGTLSAVVSIAAYDKYHDGGSDKTSIHLVYEGEDGTEHKLESATIKMPDAADIKAGVTLTTAKLPRTMFNKPLKLRAYTAKLVGHTFKRDPIFEESARSTVRAVTQYPCPSNLQATEENGKVKLTWKIAPGGTTQDAYRIKWRKAETNTEPAKVWNDVYKKLSDSSPLALKYVSSPADPSVTVEFPETDQGTHVYEFLVEREKFEEFDADYNAISGGLTLNTDNVKLSSFIASPDPTGRLNTVKWVFDGGRTEDKKFSVERKVENDSPVEVVSKQAIQGTSGEQVVSLNDFNCKSYHLIIKIFNGNNNTPYITETVGPFAVGAATASEIGRMYNLRVSKGFFSDKVKIQWNVTSNPGFSSFVVWRKTDSDANSDFVMIKELPAAAVSLYEMEDVNAVPGIYYTYKVEAMKLAIDEGADACTAIATATIAQTELSIGFRQPYGVAQGRVSFNGGQTPVPNVSVIASSDIANPNKAIAFSTGRDSLEYNVVTQQDEITGTSIDTTYIITPYNGGLSASQFSFQAYVKKRKHGTAYLFGSAGRYGISMTTLADTIFDNREEAVKRGVDVADTTVMVVDTTYSAIVTEFKLYAGSNEITLPVTKKIWAKDYIHVTVTFDGTTAKLYLDGKLISQAAAAFGGTFSTAGMSYFGTDSLLTSRFDGYMDEVRLWKTALDSAKVAQTFDRFIVGKDNDLVLYYRFNELDVNYDIFDVSATTTGTTFNENHGKFISPLGFAPHVPLVPTKVQLAVKATTDQNGNYLINTIPYVGDGSTSEIKADFGVHTFSPPMKAIFFNANSQPYTQDFEDQSSFPVSGKVVFDGGDYPVAGCSFTVDGITQLDGDNRPILSDAAGKYQLNVPIGRHRVQVEKTGHGFVNNGKALDPTNGLDIDYAQERVGLNFYDTTRVRLIGYIVGGNREANKASGFGLRKNNLGADSLTLWAKNDGYDLRTAEKDSSVFVYHTQVNDDGKVVKDSTLVTFKYDTGDDHNAIIIHVSPTTGEFMADLYPIEYRIKPVGVKDAEGTQTIYSYSKSVEPLDLTDATVPDERALSYSVRNWVDSVFVDAATLAARGSSALPYFEYTENTDTVRFNKEKPFKIQVEPSWTYQQLYYDDVVGYYGDSIYEVNGEEIPLTYFDENGVRKYVFDYPVFQQGTRYDFKIKSSQVYTNLKTGAVDMVPVAGGTVEFTSALSADTKPTKVILNAAGEGVYAFIGGAPNLTAPGLNILSAMLGLDGKWYPSGSGNGVGLNKGTLTAYTLGSRTTGTDFLTAAPSRVDFVLHDPPGTASTAFISSGTTFSHTVSESWSSGGSDELKIGALLGTKLTTLAGLGVMSGTTVNITASIGGGFSSTWSNNGNNSTTTTTTVNQTISTAANPSMNGVGADAFVGHGGDIFVGKGYNTLYGLRDAITIQPVAGGKPFKGEAFDTKSVPGGAQYKLGLLTTFMIDPTPAFETTFYFSEYEIEHTMIPKWQQGIEDQFTVPVYALPGIELPAFVRAGAEEMLNLLPAEHAEAREVITDWKTNLENKALSGDVYSILDEQIGNKSEWTISKKTGIRDYVGEIRAKNTPAFIPSDEFQSDRAYWDAVADSLKRDIYISHLPKTDINFGAPNDAFVFGTAAITGLSGPSYTMLLPQWRADLLAHPENYTDSIYEAGHWVFVGKGKGTVEFTDSIAFFSDQIEAWKVLLRENERAKVNWGQLTVEDFKDTHGAFLSYTSLPNNLRNLIKIYGNTALTKEEIEQLAADISTGKSVSAEMDRTNIQVCENTPTDYGNLVARAVSNYNDLNPVVTKNITFGTGSSVSQSKSTDYVSVSGTGGSWSHRIFAYESFKVDIAGNGVDENGSLGTNEDSSSSESESVVSNGGIGFTLGETGNTDQITVDYTIDPASGTYMFKTRAGRTSCPYEGERRTRYYRADESTDSNPELILSVRTMQVEVPVVTLAEGSNTYALNVPANEEAVYQISLVNESEIDQAQNPSASFVLSVDETSNPHGAAVFVDGYGLGNGRTLTLSKTATLKTVTISKPPLVDTCNINLVLTSACDRALSCTVPLIARFQPACTRVNIQQPFNNQIMNTSTNDPDRDQFLRVIIDGYNLNFPNLGFVELEYRSTSAPQFEFIKRFYFDRARWVALGNDTLDAARNIFKGSVDAFDYNFNMKSDMDGAYELRAHAVCEAPGGDGQNPISESYSPVVTFHRDMHKPKVMGTPEPRNGILTASDIIGVKFNEEIRPAYVNDSKITVEAILNGQREKHSTALNVNGSAAETQATVPLTGSFSIETWLRRTLGETGTIVAHGNNFSLGFTAENKLVVKFNGVEYVSDNEITEDGWQYLVFAYDQETHKFNVYSRTTNHSPAQDYPFNRAGVDVSSTGLGYDVNAKLYVGAKADTTASFKGQIHGLTLWKTTRTDETIEQRDYAKTGNEPYLIGYWPLTEGHGASAVDKARSRNLLLPAGGVNGWFVNAQNKAVQLDGSTKAVAIPAGDVSLKSDDSFTLEFWFKGDTEQQEVTMFSSGDGVEDYVLTEEGVVPALGGKLSIGFDGNSNLTLKANGASRTLSTTKFLDDTWHHFALNLLRAGGAASSAIVYVDGVNVKELPVSAFTSLERDTFYLGARNYKNEADAEIGATATDRYFKGAIDEFRIWKGSRTASLIRENIYDRLLGTESGLIAYYPFEEIREDGGGQYAFDYWLNLVDAKEKEERISSAGSSAALASAQAMAVGTAGIIGNAPLSLDNSPVLKEARAPQGLRFDFAASATDGITIDLKQAKADIEHTTVTVSIRRSGVQDIHGNSADAISWSFYVNNNRLLWKNVPEEDIITKKYLETKQFTATISNASGVTENWTITGLPTWLTANKYNGSLAPLSNYTLTFTINANAPIGSYDEVITLSGNEDMTSLLKLQFEILGEQPNWEVDPTQYGKSMTLIGRVDINRVVEINSKDLVAAFIDGECVGLASPTYSAIGDNYFVYLTIHGDDVAGKRVIFKVYDVDADITYAGISASDASGVVDVLFQEDAMYGSFGNPIVLTVDPNIQEQQVDLNEGWTWASFNIAMPDMTIENVFRDVKPAAVMVKSKEVFTRPKEGTWKGELTAAEAGKMYKIQMNKAVPLMLAGSRVDPVITPMTINVGWTWLAYTSNTVLSVDAALAGLSASDGDMIKSKDKFSMYLGPTLGWTGGDLTELVPGKGYLYKSNGFSAKTFFYPQNNVRSAALWAPTAVAPEYWTSSSAYKYSSNMNIIAVVKDNDKVLRDVEVAVFAGDECRGVKKVTDDSLLFITVAGDEREKLNFRVYANGKEYEVAQEETYQSDTLLGLPRAPYVIQLTTVPQSDNIRITPTKVKHTFEVVAENGKTLRSIAIYDVKGHLVQRISEVKTSRKKMDVANLLPDVYLVAVETTDGERLMARIVKE